MLQEISKGGINMLNVICSRAWTLRTGVFAACLIVLTACGSSASTAVEAPAADPPSSAEVAEPETADEQTTADAPATTEPTETTAAPVADEEEIDEPDPADRGEGASTDDGISCIEGDWTITEAELSGYFAALGDQSGVPMSSTGTARLRFIDSQFTYDAVFQLQMDLGDETAIANSDGVAVGSYAVEDGVISTELEANSIDVVVNVGGFELSAGELGNDFLTAFPVNDARFSCDGPTIYFQSGASSEHPIQLTPFEG